MRKLFIVLAVMAGLSCVDIASARTVVKPGIEVLRDGGFKELQGKRVGLVTNPSGVDRYLRSTIDILYNAPAVDTAGPVQFVRHQQIDGINDGQHTMLFACLHSFDRPPRAVCFPFGDPPPASTCTSRTIASRRLSGPCTPIARRTSQRPFCTPGRFLS